MATAAEQLEEARLALERCAMQGRALAVSIGDDKWTTRPAAGGWSPAECFMHLNLTTAGMLPLLKTGVEVARVNNWRAGARLRVGLLGRVLCWALEPPYRIRTRTQPAFVPEAGAAKTVVMPEWDRLHEALDALIRDGAGLALDKPKILSPFDPRGKMRYSVYAALRILVAHEHRHLWQARRAAG